MNGLYLFHWYLKIEFDSINFLLFKQPKENYKKLYGKTYQNEKPINRLCLQAQFNMEDYFVLLKNISVNNFWSFDFDIHVGNIA